MALLATLVGFGFLVVALVTGTLWLAIACIAVCVVGVLFLVADLVGVGASFTSRRGDRPPDDHVVPVVDDSETTSEIPRFVDADAVVSLDDAGPSGQVQPTSHGRHESPADTPTDDTRVDDVEEPSRAPRHGRNVGES